MITKRIKQIIDFKQISERRFCKEVGISNGFLGKVKDIGSNKLNKILDTYPEINPLWLLRGDGSMLVEKNTPSVIVGEARESNNTCSKEVDYLKNKIVLLENSLKDKDEIIRLMRGQNKNIFSSHT